MNRVRCLVNAELDTLLPNGNTKTIQIGAGTFLEVESVQTYVDNGETFADIKLVDGAVLYGVLWSDEYWENHGAPQSEKEVEENNDSIEILESGTEEETEGNEQWRADSL